MTSVGAVIVRQQGPQVHVDHGLAGALEDVHAITLSQNVLDHIDGAAPARAVEEAARQCLHGDQLGQRARAHAEALGDIDPAAKGQDAGIVELGGGAVDDQALRAIRIFGGELLRHHSAHGGAVDMGEERPR